MLDDVIHPDYLWRSPGQEIHGLEGFKELLQGFRTAFSDMHLHVDDMVFSGNKVVTCFTSTGTHDGDFMGIPPTNKPVKNSMESA